MTFKDLLRELQTLNVYVDAGKMDEDEAMEKARELMGARGFNICKCGKQEPNGTGHDKYVLSCPGCVAFFPVSMPSADEGLRLRVLQVIIRYGGSVESGDGIPFREIRMRLQVAADDTKHWRQIDRAVQWLRKKGRIVTKGQRWYSSGDPRNEDVAALPPPNA
jgi:hypothetical protein